MIRLYLKAQCEGKQHRREHRLRQPRLPRSRLSCLILTGSPISLIQPIAAFESCHRASIGVDDSGEHPRKKRNRLHFSVVPHLNNLHIIRTECDCNRASYRRHESAAKRKHQQESAQKSDEEIGRRTPAGQQQVVHPLRPVTVEIVNRRSRGHSAEHRVSPLRLVFRMLSIVGHSLVRHTLP